MVYEFYLSKAIKFLKNKTKWVFKKSFMEDSDHWFLQKNNKWGQLEEMSEQLSSNLRKNKILTNKKRVGIGVYIANVLKKKSGGSTDTKPDGIWVWAVLL